MSDQSATFSVNLATFEYLFFVAEWLPLWRPITEKLKIGKIWNMIFHSFQHIAHLLWKYGHFWGGCGGLHILLCDRAQFVFQSWKTGNPRCIVKFLRSITICIETQETRVVFAQGRLSSLHNVRQRWTFGPFLDDGPGPLCM